MVGHGTDQLSASINYMEDSASVRGKNKKLHTDYAKLLADGVVLSENAPDWVRFNYQLPIVAVPDARGTGYSSC